MLRSEWTDASETMVPGEITLLRQFQPTAPAGLRGFPVHFRLASKRARGELRLRTQAARGGVA